MLNFRKIVHNAFKENDYNEFLMKLLMKIYKIKRQKFRQKNPWNSVLTTEFCSPVELRDLLEKWKRNKICFIKSK